MLFRSVASLGGFVQTYQVTVDPLKLKSFGIPLMKVSQVIRDSNRDVGGRVVEMAETEFMVRGKGYLRSKADIEALVRELGHQVVDIAATHNEALDAVANPQDGPPLKPIDITSITITER